MTGPLGKHQIALLAAVANPGQGMIVGNAVARSLRRRGLVAPMTLDGFNMIRITPAGLRELADLHEGRVFNPHRGRGGGK